MLTNIGQTVAFHAWVPSTISPERGERCQEKGLSGQRFEYREIEIFSKTIYLNKNIFIFIGLPLIFSYVGFSLFKGKKNLS